MSGAVQRASRGARVRDLLLAVLLLRAAGRGASERRQSPGLALLPSLPIGGPTSAAWREEALARASELQALANWIAASSHDPWAGDFLAQITARLDAVRRTASGRDSRSNGKKEKPLRFWTRWWSAWRGAPFNRTLSNLDSVEADLLRLAPEAYLRGELPSVQAHVSRFLPKGDPRRDRVDQMTKDEVKDEVDRGALISAYHAANTQRRRDLLRVRDFRNVLYLVALTVILPLAIALAVLGRVDPEAVPLCFFPVEKEKVVCPTEEEYIVAADFIPGINGGPERLDLDEPISRAVNPRDIWLVEVLGIMAAAIASAVALRRIRGSSTPFPLAVALSLVKIPLGALLAVLGLLLMSGQFVPGLSALDSSAQILAWALVFGYSQQLFTRFVDQRAAVLLDKVGGRGATGDKDASG